MIDDDDKQETTCIWSRDDALVTCDVCGHGGEGYGRYCMETVIETQLGEEWVTHCKTCKPEDRR